MEEGSVVHLGDGERLPRGGGFRAACECECQRDRAERRKGQRWAVIQLMHHPGSHFGFSNIKILLYQLAKCHCLMPHKLPPTSLPIFARGQPHDPKPKGFMSGTPGAFQDLALALGQSATCLNRFASVTWVIGYFEHHSRREVNPRQKQHPE